VEKLISLGFLLVATIMEASGDALVRMGLGQAALGIRIALFALGAIPLEFGRVVGLYIAMLFIVWQFINLIAFRSAPSLAVLLGGTLIVAGGLIVTFWQPGTRI
jgi:small multidrug resistance family-3 protein